jgi:hypothetical protein
MFTFSSGDIHLKITRRFVNLLFEEDLDHSIAIILDINVFFIHSECSIFIIFGK